MRCRIEGCQADNLIASVFCGGHEVDFRHSGESRRLDAIAAAPSGRDRLRIARAIVDFIDRFSAEQRHVIEAAKAAERARNG